MADLTVPAAGLGSPLTMVAASGVSMHVSVPSLAETGTRGLLGAVLGGDGERAEVPLDRKLIKDPTQSQVTIR